MSQATQHAKKTYLSIALLTLCVAGLWLFAQQSALLSSAPPGQLTPDSECDIAQQSCTAKGSGVAITLTLPSQQPQSLKPIDFEVSVEGIQAEAVLVDLQGTEMYMGINQTELQPASQNPGLFTGQGALGACVTGEMGWRATVLVNTSQGAIKAHFDFRAK